MSLVLLQFLKNEDALVKTARAEQMKAEVIRRRG